MKRLILSIFVLVVSCCLLVPQATAAGKPDKLYIGVLADMSGPYAPVVGSFRPGYIDACKYINEKFGGIKGVPVEPLIRDNGGKVAVSLAQYNELINRKPRPIFIDTAFSPVAEALRPRYVEDDMLGIHAGNLVAVYPLANSYAYYPMYDEWFGFAAKYFKSKWKEKRKLRVGVITWDTAYGRGMLTEKFFAYLKEIGVDLAGKPQLFGIRDVEVTTQLMKLRSWKSDIVFSCITGGGVLAVKKGMNEMGWDVPYLANGLDLGTLNLDTVTLDGIYVQRSGLSWNETDHPAMKFLMKQFKKNNRKKKDRSAFYMIAWVNMAVEHKVMTEVVEKYGWDGLTTKNLMAAMNRVKEFLPWGGLMKITYTAKRPVPKHLRMYQSKKGKLLPVSDWAEVPDFLPTK
ncbi:MAG: ABC transporter substrate-binding protein [Desulfobacteraceae bacterium]|nr:ABC transporter substrate-binding protein [Desulfobacteraceae bacterium]